MEPELSRAGELKLEVRSSRRKSAKGGANTREESADKTAEQANPTRDKIRRGLADVTKRGTGAGTGDGNEGQ